MMDNTFFGNFQNVMGRLNPAAQLRWGCCSSMSLGPNSNKAGLYSYSSVLVGTHTDTCMQCVYIHTLYMWPATQINRWAQYSCRHKQQQRPHPSPLAACSGLRPISGEYIMCIYVQYGSLQQLGFRQSLSPACSPRYPLCWYWPLDLWATKATAPVQLLVQTPWQMDMDTRTRYRPPSSWPSTGHLSSSWSQILATRPVRQLARVGVR